MCPENVFPSYEADPGLVARWYAELVYNRVATGLLDADHTIDWDDAPSDQKHYVDQPLIELGPSPWGEDDLTRLNYVLLNSYGWLHRRHRINGNDEPVTWTQVERARWGRGVASGGGRYPVSIYVAIGAGQKTPPGVFHYSPAHHGLRLLAAGDFTGAIATAQGYESVASTYVVLSVKFWQSAFKYADYTYQATALEAGTLLGGWEYLLGERVDADFWTNETAIAQLLNLDPDSEGIYAVIPWGDCTSNETDSTGLRVHATERERSRTVRQFKTTELLQSAAVRVPAARTWGVVPFAPPHLQPTSDTAKSQRALSERDRRDRLTATRKRESSFGRFTGEPIRRSQLGEILAQAANSSRFGELSQGGTMLKDAVRLHVFVGNVDEMEPGLYERGKESTGLVLIERGDEYLEHLAESHFLRNYDVRKSAVGIVLSANVNAYCDAGGVHGYRFINAVVGGWVQTIYAEAARLGIGCGAVLGFDPAAVSRVVKLDGDEHQPLIVVMLGINDTRTGSYHSRLHEPPGHKSLAESHE